MARLLLIADDLTGTFDAAVPFVSAGVAVVPTPDLVAFAQALDSGVYVVAVNSDSRHLSPFAAHLRICNLVDTAVKAGVRVIFKKTDSVLRGNIGSELKAVWDVSGRGTCLHFVPGWPAMGRTTRGGIHFVNDVPVDQSKFGRDPFDPVPTSSVSNLIASQADVPVLSVACGEPCPIGFEGIAVYDAVTDEDVRSRAQEIVKTAPRGTLYLAGCAGLAHAISSFLGCSAVELGSADGVVGNTLVVCGSVNAVSVAQCQKATAAGAPTVPVTVAQKKDPAWVASAEGGRLVEEVRTSWASAPLTVVDATSFVPDDASANDNRAQVADVIGSLTARIAEQAPQATLVCIGGDIMLSFLRQLPDPQVRMLGEVVPGVVASDVTVGGRSLRVLSKSGGFGGPDLLLDIYNKNE